MGQSNSPSENYLFLNVMINFVIVNQKLTGSALHIEKNQTIRKIDFTLLAWLLIQDKKSTRLNSIVSSPIELLAAMMFNKTRLNLCEFIGYNLDSRSFSTKNKTKLHLF